MKDDTEKQNEDLHKKVEAMMGPTFDQKIPQLVKDAKKNTAATTPVPGAPEVGSSSPSMQTKPTNKEEQVSRPKDDDLDEFVDDIAAKESDELLKVEDEKVAKAFEPKVQKTIPQKIGDFFKNWWHNKKARNATFAFVFVAVLALTAVPTSRYFILNTAGVRTKASVVVIDESTQQPLRDVQVSVNDVVVQSDETGTARIEKLKLGKNTIKIEKRAFAETSKTVTLGLGSNPLGNVGLQPTGVQYTFIVKDYLSDKPIEKVEAVAGTASAFSDAEGKVVVTVDKQDVDSVTEATLNLDGYRSETEKLDDSTDKDVKMVSAHKHSFVSKRSGKYDLYKIDADGKNEEIVLAGTGYEKDDIALVPHGSTNTVAYASTRENTRNSDGYLLSTLLVVDLDDQDGTPVKIAQAERIQVLGWSGDRLVYVRATEGQSAANNQRHKLMSYDNQSGESKELASVNYFNDVLMAGNTIYYAPSVSGKKAEVGMFAIKADGSDKKTIINQETWNIYRTGYDTLTFAVGQQWYNYKFGDEAPTAAEGQPSEQKTRVYSNNANDTQSLWVDQRDGKGVLISYDTASSNDNTLTSASGLKYPVSWLGNKTVVYRVNTEQESADYAISLDGGEPRKITNVTNTDGVDAWYYY